MLQYLKLFCLSKVTAAFHFPQYLRIWCTDDVGWCLQFRIFKNSASKVVWVSYLNCISLNKTLNNVAAFAYQWF